MPFYEKYGCPVVALNRGWGGWGVVLLVDVCWKKRLTKPACEGLNRRDLGGLAGSGFATAEVLIPAIT